MVFTMYIKQILSTLKSESKIVYITGDININLLNIDTNIPSSAFVETMYTYSFFLLINKPTRIGRNCATLIDNIYCNNINGTVKRVDFGRLQLFFISTLKAFSCINDCINDFNSKFIITGIVKCKFVFSYVVRTQFFFNNLKCPKSPRKWGDLGHM